MTDRAAFNWELQKSTVVASQHDRSKSADFLNKIRNSERVSNFIKQKTDLEILIYYHFIRDDVLTHLGILCIGLREDRAILNTAPIVQYIKYDEREQKIRKLVWDDYELAPWELIVIASYFGVLINTTPSMKLGFYIRSYSPICRGDIIAFCLMDPYKTLGLSRLYIQKGGKCDGSDPLIKEIIAVPGDHVILKDNYIAVNGNKFFYKTLYQDREGRALGIYPRGDYPNTQGYWMIGTHVQNSWDCRYWGAISKSQILYKLKPWFTL